MRGFVLNAASESLDHIRLQSLEKALYDVEEQSTTCASALEALASYINSLVSAGTCTIPERAWQKTANGAVACIPIPTVTGEHVPQVVVSDGGASVAVSAGMELVCTTAEGVVKVYADEAPTDDIEISLVLFRVTNPLVITWPKE